MPLVVPEIHEFYAVLDLAVVATDDHELIHIFTVVMNKHRGESTLGFSHLDLRDDVPGVSAFIIHLDHINPLALCVLAAEDPDLLLYSSGLPVLWNDHGLELRPGDI